jgi:HK97 family phage major capsid protein
MATEAIDLVLKQLDGIEAKLEAASKRSDEDMKNSGALSTELKNEIAKLGEKQLELSLDLVELKSRHPGGENETKAESIGEQFVKNATYGAYIGRTAPRATLEVKNTITNAIGNTWGERQPGIVSGAFRNLTILDRLNSVTTSAPSITYVRENVFTNSAAETAEAGQKPESSLTLTEVTEPIQTIAHWIKITKQLASDNTALSAYIDTRMTYGVLLRLENQLISGNGTAPNISGLTKSGNFTAHGYTAANLTSAGLTNNRFDLIGATIGDTQAADYPADTILVNPSDWWKMRLAKDTTGAYMFGVPGSAVAQDIFSLPVVVSPAVPAGKVIIASLSQAAVFYQREGVVIEMSDSDSDNFTKNLVTIRAEMRGALAVERPAAIRYGDLVPA